MDSQATTETRKSQRDLIAELDARVELKKVRHRACYARLFSSPVPWHETDAKNATIAIRCWRCGNVVCLAAAELL
jgi:hypothetical protein